MPWFPPISCQHVPVPSPTSTPFLSMNTYSDYIHTWRGGTLTLGFHQSFFICCFPFSSPAFFKYVFHDPNFSYYNIFRLIYFRYIIYQFLLPAEVKIEERLMTPRQTNQLIIFTLLISLSNDEMEYYFSHENFIFRWFNSTIIILTLNFASLSKCFRFMQKYATLIVLSIIRWYIGLGETFESE